MNPRCLGVCLVAVLVYGLPAAVSAQATAEHDHAAPATPQAPPSAPVPLPPFIPPVTDADRAAAFPDVLGHTVHDNATNSFVLIDQLEWRGDGAVAWENRGWIGKDRDRFWFRTEGDVNRDGLEQAIAHALYGRQISPWWDVVAGVRQDVGPGPDRTWAAIGLQGLAPYWFEVELTGYVGTGGQTHLRLETEYELLVTNRLILQPLLEVELYGKADPARDIGAGLSAIDLGVRLRYEIRRELAPYVGVVWARPFFGTAKATSSHDTGRGTTQVVVGGRFWF